MTACTSMDAKENDNSLPLEGRQFYRTALNIGVPVAVQNLISIALNMVDNMMIGRLGLEELAGVGAASRIFMIYAVICCGFFSGTSVFAAQYWGAGDIKNIRRVQGINYVVAAIIAILTMVLTYFYAPEIIHFFNKEQAVISLGAEYLQTVQFSYLFVAISLAISFTCRSVHRLKIVTVISALALGTNTLLNYCLIYGNLGFPALGIKGAAIATVIARGFEFIALLAYLYASHDHPLAAPLRQLFSWRTVMLRDIIRTATPATISETTYAVGQALFFVAFGKIGSAEQAVSQAAAVATDLAFAFFYGIANACSVMLGNQLGVGNKTVARRYSRKFIFIAAVGSIVSMLLFAIAKQPIIHFYKLGDAAALLNQTMNVYIYCMVPNVLSYFLLIGVLRAAGDTTCTMLLDMVSVWCISIPLCFVAVRMGTTLPMAVFISILGKFFVCIASVLRMRGEKWLHIVI